MGIFPISGCASVGDYVDDIVVPLADANGLNALAVTRLRSHLGAINSQISL